MRNGRPFSPMRSWLNTAGPRLVSRIAAAASSIGTASSARAARARTMSMAAFDRRIAPRHRPAAGSRGVEGYRRDADVAVAVVQGIKVSKTHGAPDLPVFDWQTFGWQSLIDVLTLHARVSGLILFFPGWPN